MGPPIGAGSKLDYDSLSFRPEAERTADGQLAPEWSELPSTGVRLNREDAS